MDILTLREQIKNNTLDNFYIFTGDEVAVMDIYIKQISTVKNIDIVHKDCVKDIIQTITKKSFIPKDYCYIIRDDSEFIKNDKEQEFVLSHLNNNILVLILTTVDKRTKFYTQYADKIIPFEPLGESILVKYIQKDYDLSTKECKILIDVCENNYNRILLELDKVKQFENATQSQGFMKLLSDGTIYQPPKDAIFDFVKAVCKGQYKCFDLLDESMEYGENVFALLTVLYTNLKQILQVQCCQSDDIAQSTGLTTWQIRNAKECMGVYSASELLHALKVIRRVEMGIKLGEIDQDIAMDYVLVSIL